MGQGEPGGSAARNWVRTLRKGARGNWYVSVEGSAKQERFDAAALAAPYGSTRIKINAPELHVATTFPRVVYVHLHITVLATTTEHPQASYFFPNAAPGTKVCKTILITSSGPVEPEFNSMSYIGNIQRAGKGPEHIVKIFSKARVEDDWLDKIFGAGAVGWVHRKEWDLFWIATNYDAPTSHAYAKPLLCQRG